MSKSNQNLHNCTLSFKVHFAFVRSFTHLLFFSSPPMPFQVAGATLVILAVTSVEVHHEGIEIFGTDNPMDLEHGEIKEYTIALCQYRSRVTVHGLRQIVSCFYFLFPRAFHLFYTYLISSFQDLDEQGNDIVVATFDLALIFNDGAAMVQFCNRLAEVGYIVRPRRQVSNFQIYFISFFNFSDSRLVVLRRNASTRVLFSLNFLSIAQARCTSPNILEVYPHKTSSIKI